MKVFQRKKKHNTIAEQLESIQKSYRDVIIPLTRSPVISKQYTFVYVDSIESLISICEIIRKPILYDKNESFYQFYLIDDMIIYIYILGEKKMITNKFSCLNCKTIVDAQGFPGEKVQIVCSHCNKKGVIQIIE